MGKVVFQQSIKDELQIKYIKDLPGLREVEMQMFKNISNSCDDIHVICKDMIQSGGKRIRPILVLCSCQCLAPLNKAAIQTAVACEFIHMASLIHDDVIDRAYIRRNRPTVNAQKGNRVSILMGDYLFAKSFEILSKNRLVNGMEFIVEAIAQMCDGEIFQEGNRFNFNQTIEDYYKRIYQKTGILIAASCQAGAVAGGATKKEIKAFETYGRNIGYAFQIVDDILDFIGDEIILGKPIGCDLKEGHITLPVLKLIEDEKYKKMLQKIYDTDGDLSKYHGEILKYLKDNKAIEFSYQEAEICANTAKSALSQIKDSPYKRLLLGLADSLLMRVC